MSVHYSGTSLTRNSAPLRPHSRTMPRAIRCPQGGELFIMREVPLYLFLEPCRALNPQPSTLNPQPSTLNLRLLILNPQLPTLLLLLYHSRA